YATGRPDRQVGFVAASPSGSRIALVRALSSDRGYLDGDILMIDPATGDITEIDTSGADVSYLSWRDDEHLVYVGLRHLEAVIGEVAASAGPITEVWSG